VAPTHKNKRGVSDGFVVSFNKCTKKDVFRNLAGGHLLFFFSGFSNENTKEGYLFQNLGGN